MLELCLLGYIAGGIILIIFAVLLIYLIRKRNSPEGTGMALTFLLIFSGAALYCGIYHNVEGVKEYDKTIEIYSIQESDTFTLGVGDGKYYYNLNNSYIQLDIDNVNASKTKLIQYSAEGTPHMVKHKVKWEYTEYHLYVPENVKLVQYTFKD